MRKSHQRNYCLSPHKLDKENAKGHFSPLGEVKTGHLSGVRAASLADICVRSLSEIFMASQDVVFVINYYESAGICENIFAITS